MSRQYDSALEMRRFLDWALHSESGKSAVSWAGKKAEADAWIQKTMSRIQFQYDGRKRAQKRTAKKAPEKADNVKTLAEAVAEYRAARLAAEYRARKVKEYQEAYYKRHKEKVKKRSKDWYYKQKKEDPTFMEKRNAYYRKMRAAEKEEKAQ